MNSESLKTHQPLQNSKILSKTDLTEKENVDLGKEEDYEMLEKKMKIDSQKKIEIPKRNNQNKEEVTETGSTTGESLDGERYATFLQKLERKYKIERKMTQIEAPTKDTKETQTQNIIPKVLKTFYDDNKCDLIFQILVNGEVVEVPRLELMQKDPKLILYFYEMHIEFTDPTGKDPLILDKV